MLAYFYFYLFATFKDFCSFPSKLPTSFMDGPYQNMATLREEKFTGINLVIESSVAFYSFKRGSE